MVVWPQEVRHLCAVLQPYNNTGDEVDCCRNQRQIGNKVDCRRSGGLDFAADTVDIVAGFGDTSATT